MTVKLQKPYEKNGEGGIRTPGTVTGTQHFQCCTIGHSATSPLPSFAGLPVCSAVRKLVIPQFLLRLTQALAHPRVAKLIAD